MRIGFDAKRLYNNFTGLGNHNRTTIDILTEYYPDNDYCLFTPKVRNNSTTAPYLSKLHTELIVPTGMIKGGLWRTLALSDECAKAGVDVFHGLSNELPVGLKCPSVVTIHDVAFKTFPGMYHWQDRQIYNLKWRYACRHADRIIAISECTKRDIVEYYGVDESRIDIVYQPVNVRFYDPVQRCVDTDSPFLLYVGSINSRKNLLGIVQAIEMLPKDLQIPLVIVGGGHEYKTKVLNYISSHHLEHLFIWKNTLTLDEIQNLYLAATAFIYPSFYEGFGLPVVEALLSECPVITSNVSSLPEAGGPYSLKVNPADVSDISHAIEHILTHPEESASNAVKGRSWALETYHPKVLAQHLMQVYNKII